MEFDGSIVMVFFPTNTQTRDSFLRFVNDL